MKRLLVVVAATAATTASAHMTYINTQSEYDAFVATHADGPYKLVVYDTRHAGSVRLMEDARAAATHVATAAVLAPAVAEFRRGRVPRVVDVARRRRRRRALGDAAGATAETEAEPENIFEFGAHHGEVDTVRTPHWLLLAGNHEPALAMTLFADMAARTPRTKFVFAHTGADTARLFGTFGYKPYMPHRVLWIDGIVPRWTNRARAATNFGHGHHTEHTHNAGDADPSFEFTTRAEFEARAPAAEA
jgi:predicted TIM-barrel fold metal-dependent hydrolase